MNNQMQFASERVKILQNMVNLPAYTSSENIDQNVIHLKMTDHTMAEFHSNTRNKRNTLTAQQRGALEMEFTKSPYIDRDRREEVAAELKLSSQQVRIWFRNKRISEVRKSKSNKPHKENQPRNGIARTESSLFRAIRSPPTSTTTTNLSFLMDGVTVTQYCGYWDHDFSCRCSRSTRISFNQSFTLPSKFYIGPMKSHASSSACTSFDDYEYDFFSDYS